MFQDEVDGVRLQSGDCRSVLTRWPDASVDLFVTSPPYHLGKDHEQGPWSSLAQCKADMRRIVRLAVRKLRPGGRVCWQVGSHVRDGEVIPLDMLFCDLFHAAGLKLRNRLIWQFNFGLHARRRFSGRYETILWFTKGDDDTFNLDPIRVPQIYLGRRHATRKGERGGQPSGNPFGKNPSDHWVVSGDCLREESVWHLPNVIANHPEKTEHPCQFPVEPAERCVLGLPNPGDLVADPFAGTGTTLAAARHHGRRAWGIDRRDDYLEIARERLDRLSRGESRVRPSGRATREPDLTKRRPRITPEDKAGRKLRNEVRGVFERAGFRRHSDLEGRNIAFTVHMMTGFDLVFTHENLIVVVGITTTPKVDDHFRRKKGAYAWISQNFVAALDALRSLGSGLTSAASTGRSLPGRSRTERGPRIWCSG